MGLLLGKKKYELNMKTRDTCLMLWEGSGVEKLVYCIDFNFLKNSETGWMPSFCINPIETTYTFFEELVGQSFKVETLEESDEREDSFYIYEHEPLERYEVRILDRTKDYAHVKCNGIAIVDGYAKPYTTMDFTIDCWLPIITNVKDWDKFEH